MAATIEAPFLGEIIERLRDAFDPDRIFLFGSYAWGTPTKHSDIDLLVVVSSSELSTVKRGAIASRSLRGIKVAVDVIVRTRDEFERYARARTSLEADINERGRLIYERGEEGIGPSLAHQGLARP